jgi:cytochrome c oxidase subunit II
MSSTSHDAAGRATVGEHPSEGAGMTRRRRLVPIALVLPLILLISACAADAPQDTLDPAGPFARKIDNLVNPVFLIAGIVFVLVQVGTVAMVWHFRRRGDDDALPAQTHGNIKLEIGWTVLPAVLLGVIGFFTLVTLFDMERADADALSVQVVGNQWWWEYRYDTTGDGQFTDDDVITANDMVIPAGRDVTLEITSNDVIHSFWIPRLNGKKDAVPGRTHPLHLHADEPGTYVGQCTEFCGLSHAYMRQRVIALEPGEYEAWLENQTQDAEMPTDDLAAAGADLFTSQCSQCHLARGINDAEYDDLGRAEEALVAGNAPDLTHFATRGAFAGAMFDLWVDADGDGIVEWDEIGGELNRADLEAWLRNPPGEKPMSATLDELGEGELVRGMPNFNLPEDQIDQLVAFLETLD